MLTVENFPDDGDHPRDAYFGIRSSKLDGHNLYDLFSAAAKSLMVKLKVQNLKILCFLENTFS